LAETNAPKVCMEADGVAERLSALWVDTGALTTLTAVNSGPAWQGEIRAIDTKSAAADAGTSRCNLDRERDGAHCMGSPRSEQAARQQALAMNQNLGERCRRTSEECH
jgi:hypothetical protein